MRQALFAVVLVAASFAGGAFVNGPGLRWAQSMLMQRLGMEPGDVDTVPPQPFAGTASPAPTPAPTAPAPSTVEAASPASPESEGIPASPIPPLVVEPRTTPAASPTPAPATTATSPSPPAAADKPLTEDLLPPAPPSDSSAPAMAEAPPARSPVADAALALARLAGASPKAEEPAPTPAAPGGLDDWPAVRRALRDLGVSRYGTEAEPGGRARFHCVIPLAGKRAVGQHFEAEGDDELLAARAAIRRVALWRATEAPALAPAAAGASPSAKP